MWGHTFGVGEYTVEQSAEVAKELVDQGYTRLKMVVGEPKSEKKDMAFWGSAPCARPSARRWRS